MTTAAALLAECLLMTGIVVGTLHVIFQLNLIKVLFRVMISILSVENRCIG